MNISPTTPPYEYEHHHTRQERLPGLKRIFDLINHSVTRSDTVPSQPPSPPDLLHDSEEDDEDTLSTPSLSLSPKQGFLSKDHDLISRSSHHHRIKSVPYKSPSLDQQLVDKSVVFQLGIHANKTLTSHHDEFAANPSCPDCDWKCTSKIIYGQSLLSNLRKRVTRARSLQPPVTVARLSRRKHTRTASIIEIPRPNYRRHYNSLPDNNSNCVDDDDDDDESVRSNSNKHHHEESVATTNVPGSHPWSDHQPYNKQEFIHRQQTNQDHDQHQVKRVKKSSNTPRRRSSTHGSSSGRPSRVKGPCQACQEPSDGCMRKAFNWPFPSNQIFNDKGKSFVYLCNKCGLR
jgi:hypothetical protein